MFTSPETISYDEIEKIEKKYGDLSGQISLVELHKGNTGLGLSLAGHKDRKKMSVFICGMHPNGSAAKDGRVAVADEILEVNGVVLYGRCHLNASATIKSLPGPIYKIILRRRDGALNEMAVKPLTHFPVHLEDEALKEKYCRFTGVRTVTVRKNNHGLGIMIIEGKHGELGRGVFISDIQIGSPAEQSGLSVGDMILCVNQTDLIGADYDTAASSLKNTEGLLSIVVAKPSKTSLRDCLPTDDNSPLLMNQVKKEKSAPPLPPPKPIRLMHRQDKDINSNNSLSPILPTNLPALTTLNANSTQPNNEESANVNKVNSFSKCLKEPPELALPDPKSCEIQINKETTIEIAKEKTGLGLSIVGGVDTPLGIILIHEIYPDGAAHQDGRLKSGDVLLQVNEENLRNAPHDRALVALRQTLSTVKIVVFREDSSITNGDIYEVMDIELNKKPGKGLGLSIVGRKNGPGVYVSEIVKGGVAETDGRLLQGDHILNVNGNDLRNATHEYAATVLKTTMGKLCMKIGRLKVASRIPVTSDKEESPHVFTKNELQLSYKEIKLTKNIDGLGFSIVGGHGSQHGDFPIYVKSIFDQGAAAEEGHLKRGDQIVAVNDKSMEGATHQEAVEILKNFTGTVTLTVISN